MSEIEKTITKTIAMLAEISKFAKDNPTYVEQTDLPDCISGIYQEVLEVGQQHVPKQYRSF